MITNNTYGRIIVWSSLAFLMLLLVCSFVVSFQIIDIIYALIIIVFTICYFRMK